MKIIVEDLKSPELELYSLRSEVKLYRYNEPEPGLFIAESAKIAMRALEKGYEPISLLVDRDIHNSEVNELIENLEENVPVYLADNEVLQQITGFNLTRGVLCAMVRKPLMTLEEMCQEHNLLVVMEDVENPTNVGAIFRNAAALGMDGVVLTHGCTDPLYRRAIRVSMGTVFNLPWTFADKKEDYVSVLQKNGYKVIALALDNRALRLGENEICDIIKQNEKLALVLGNEGYGITPENLEKCDYTVMIPMYHDTDSLNVAMASAVAFWEFKRNKND